MAVTQHEIKLSVAVAAAQRDTSNFCAAVVAVPQHGLKVIAVKDPLVTFGTDILHNTCTYCKNDFLDVAINAADTLAL